jgi:hypothetical protein
MSEPPVGESNGKKNPLVRISGRIEPYKNLLWLLGTVAGLLLGYLGGLEKAKEVSRTEMAQIETRIRSEVAQTEARIGKRVDGEQAAIKVMEDEQRKVRSYLQDAQVTAGEAFRADCTGLKGDYSPNDKTCTYLIENERKTVRFPFLAPQEVNYPALTP